jgi:hypothetical protein
MSIETALAWAESQVGVTEHPPGSNDVPYWSEWQQGTGQTYGHNGLPWCGAFLWLALQAGGWKAPADWIGVPNIITWGKANGRWHAGTAGLQRGDVLVYWGGTHTGLALGPEVADGIYVHAVEGNTSMVGSQDNGGAVLERLRSASSVTGYVRVADLLAPKPTPGGTDVAAQLPTIGYGNQGDDVRTWQGLLVARGHTTVPVDGKYGDLTKTATRHLQELHKLPQQNGTVVDAPTWRAGLGLA